MAVEKFAINVSDTVLADLRDRLAATRWPDEIEHTGWDPKSLIEAPGAELPNCFERELLLLFSFGVMVVKIVRDGSGCFTHAGWLSQSSPRTHHTQE